MKSLLAVLLCLSKRTTATRPVKTTDIRKIPSLYGGNKWTMDFSSRSISYSKFEKLFEDVITPLSSDTKIDERNQIFHNIFIKQPFLQSLKEEESKDLFDNLYWIVFQFLKQQFVKKRLGSFSDPSRKVPLFVGLSAPQVRVSKISGESLTCCIGKWENDLDRDIAAILRVSRNQLHLHVLG